MIPMSELVQDRFYNAFLNSPPEVPPHTQDKSFYKTAPWVVYVQRRAGGKWGKREFWKYKKALKFLRHALDVGVHDAALNNRRIWSPPPHRIVRIRGKYVQDSRGKRVQATKMVEWKPKLGQVINGVPIIDMEDHEWCGYCRRPTVFRHFSQHRMIGHVSNQVDRCIICGASRRIAPTPKRRRM